MKRGRTATVLLLLAAALAASAVAGLALGPVRIAPGRVLDLLLAGPGARGGAFASIVWDVRMPRVLLGAVVGAGLAVTGTVLQALVRNQLADPFLLGASSGASAGAVLVIVFGTAAGAGAVGALGGAGVPLAAFAGSMAALVTVYALARRGATMTTGRLILAGVAVQYVLSALTSLVLVLSASPDQMRSVLFWTLGGLGGARWSELALPAAALFVGTGVLVTLARPLDLLLAGEEGAHTLGLDTGRFRAAAFVLTSLVIGVLVASSGAIGFVGLMVPHAARMVVGAGHRALLPVAALGGAVFLTLADLLARTAAAPEEIPVGVVTALVGGPFFLWMLRRSGRGEGVTG
ncbi:Hemin transport system permease protein HmuU [Streptomyces lavendulae subsp. lavendulae]|uniref:Hemin transport system permease protein HmuU n=1 Tax=Streptomyces lavendulae subsp. lavendulae TaxID=58340 RepID=A0A2K8P9L0_STRLA|nr:iron ABC transporter permease [Streptomyces lavendulae]ATZ22780.1 Hemin transport system permease protein HmuU [Streptomyces lavendulae subsp. lavendulae]QUQ52622.1 Hemin transport system permease protein HmuU [Streptomyces lavendulae subsp. lavendulae]